MSINYREAILPFVVREAGEINLQATFSKFQSIASQEIASQKAEESFVISALSSVFDEHAGSGLNKPFIVNQAIEKMKLADPTLKDPKMYTVLQKRASEVLKDQIEAGVYVSTHGPKGSTRRVSDLTS
jgi:hypothetical protein